MLFGAPETAWKMLFKHHEAHRPENSEQPPGYSRHDYDACRMAPISELEHEINAL